MRFKLRLQPSTVIATLALFVAMGGTSYAVSNSISGSQLKNHSVAGINGEPHGRGTRGERLWIPDGPVGEKRR